MIIGANKRLSRRCLQRRQCPPKKVATAPASTDPNQPFELACRFDLGGMQQDKNLHIVPAMQQVDGHTAIFAPDEISYSVITERGILKIKVTHHVVINRITGTVTMTGPRKSIEAGAPHRKRRPMC